MTHNYKFEIYKDQRGEYRWRVTANNGNIVGASSEGYSNSSAARQNAFKLGDFLDDYFDEDEEEN